MSDISAQLRRASEVYSDSYPPDILAGGSDPHINTVVPATTAVNSGLTIATLNGRNFAEDSVVEVNQAGVQSLFVSATQMQFETDLVALGVGTHQVTVRNINDEESNSAAFTITAPPTPVISTLTPATAAMSVGNVTVEIHGSGFDEGATVTQDFVNVSGQDWNSATHITAYLDAMLAGVAGTYQIRVKNLDFTSSNPSPFTWTAATAQETETEPGAYEAELTAEDVAGWTVAEAEAYVTENPDQRQAVADFERAGKARTTLLAWLESEG